MNIQQYTYQVSWSEEDQEFVGTALEFPFLSHLEPEPDAALKGIRELVAFVVEDMGDKAPTPLSKRHYSGKFQLRISPEQHRALAMEAARQNVSLNSLVAQRVVAV